MPSLWKIDTSGWPCCSFLIAPVTTNLSTTNHIWVLWTYTSHQPPLLQGCKHLRGGKNAPTIKCAHPWAPKPMAHDFSLVPECLITASISVWSLNETLDPTSLFRANFQQSPNGWRKQTRWSLFMWYSTRGTSVPSGVFFCKSFEHVLSLISIHIFRLWLTLFFVRGKYLSRKINLHILRVPAKNCCKRKLIWSAIILVLRIYCGLSSLRPYKVVGRPFCKKFWSSWNVHVTQKRSLIGFTVRKFRRSWNIWTPNANRAKDIFSSCCVHFTTLRMSHAKNFASDKRKAWVEIRLYTRTVHSISASNARIF